MVMDISPSRLILTVNAGSSSVKMSVFEAGGGLLSSFRIENIGQSQTILSIRGTIDDATEPIAAVDHHAAVAVLVDRIATRFPEDAFIAVGHRITHGGQYFTEPVIVSDDVVKTLQTVSVFDPLHLPLQIQVTEQMREHFPAATHTACFDTSFYRDMPRRAQLLPIPRKYIEKGIRRYGFHGLSYTYLVQELHRREGEEANGKVILMHLGSGASITAVQNGVPVDTTMGLTPLSGIPMSTRSGDLDPGVSAVLRALETMDDRTFDEMVATKSGLLGISETSADMATLIHTYESDERAAEAVDLFCYSVQKTIGAFATVMGGIDMIVFAGGIGENAPFIRDKITKSLGVFDVRISDSLNASNAQRISTDDSKVKVHIIRTNEEEIIAKEAYRQVKGGQREHGSAD
jgi:acetate kinase